MTRQRVPNRPPGQTLHRVGLSVTAAELAELRDRADAAMVSVPRLLVESTLGEPSGVRRADTLALLAAVDRLTRLGGNLNQMVRLAHENRLDAMVNPWEVSDLLAEIASATTEARAALARRRA